MGCWDIYCFICGNSCHGLAIDDVEYIEKVISSGKKDKFNKYIFDAYQKNPSLINDLMEFRKKINWIDKCTMLLANDKIESNCKEVNCNISFTNKKGRYLHSVSSTVNEMFDKSILYGVFIHTDCYNFVKEKYNIKLKYSMLPLIVNNKFSNKVIPFIDYGDIEQYWGQIFNFFQIVNDKKEFLCSSPLTGDKNIGQIKKNISALKINTKYIERPSPPISASFYPNGTVKVGNNNKLWMIKNGKWFELSNLKTIRLTIQYNKLNAKQQNFINTFSLHGQYNKTALFIIKSSYNRNKYILDVITTSNNISKIEELLL